VVPDVKGFLLATHRPAGAVLKAAARTPYSSAVRSNQARSTRRAIVVAAGELFVEQGYAATTIDAVAERAGVGRKTVFSSVGGKGALLKLAWDWAVTGDDEPIPMSERPAVQAILAERDPGRLVQMWVEMLLEVGARATPIGTVVLAAADVDAEARALRDLIRSESLAGATAFVTHLASVGGLRGDISIERGAEACWALVNSLLLHLLVATRGWSLQEYGEWLVRVASTTLLEPEGLAGPRAAPTIRTVHDATRERYEASVEGRIAGHLSYQRTERLVVFTRTAVEAGFDDLGVSDALVRRAFDDLRTEGSHRVVPLCHYVAWWIDRHTDYASLVYDATAD
jgi:AcrR family transcriptional regulator